MSTVVILLLQKHNLQIAQFAKRIGMYYWIEFLPCGKYTNIYGE